MGGVRIRPGARFRVIHEAVRSCNRAAILQPVAEHLPSCKKDRHPKAPFSKTRFAFNKGILLWFARLDKLQTYAPAFTPAIESIDDELGLVIKPDGLWGLSELYQPLQHPDHSGGRQR